MLRAGRLVAYIVHLNIDIMVGSAATPTHFSLDINLIHVSMTS